MNSLSRYILIFIGSTMMVFSTSYISIENKRLDGLYMYSAFKSNEFANYLLFKKKRIVKVLRSRKGESYKIIINDIEKNGTLAKYELKNDSIFFCIDSVMCGQIQTSFFAFGKQHSLNSERYKRAPIYFAGKWDTQFLSFKVQEMKPGIIVDSDWGGYTIDGLGDSVKVYFEKYSKIHK